MTLPATFHWRNTTVRVGLAMLFACLLGIQMLGFVHRVVHGDRPLAGPAPQGEQGSLWAQHDHNCQLFDALTLASCASTTPLQAAPPQVCLAFRLPRPTMGPTVSTPLGFQSRAPPLLADSRS